MTNLEKKVSVLITINSKQLTLPVSASISTHTASFLYGRFSMVISLCSKICVLILLWYMPSVLRMLHGLSKSLA